MGQCQSGGGVHVQGAESPLRNLIKRVRRGDEDAALDLVRRREIDLSGSDTTRLGAKGGRTLGRALSSPECAVEVLLLRSHYIMERGQHFMLATFCKHLAQNRTLRVLALQSSYVDDYAAERIALACPPQLEVLDLSFNLIGATNAGSGYRAIGAAIARTNVKECYLGNNRWEGLHSMFQILADCDRISRVFVREKLGDEIYTTKLVSRRTHPSSGDSGEDRRRDVIIAYSQYKSMPDLVVVTPSSEKHNEADEEKFEEEEIVAPLLPCNHEAEDEVKVDDEPLSYSTNNSTLQQPLL